jgi:hypothetical protein
MATAPKSLALRKTGKPTQRDRVIWYERESEHRSIDEIAERHRMSVPAVDAALLRMSAWRHMYSQAEIDLRYNRIALEKADKVDHALDQALRAEVVIRKVDETGKTVVDYKEPDHKTRLEAAKQAVEIANRNLPKGGGLSITNLQQQNNSGVAPVASGRSFEEVLRDRRQLKGLTNSSNVEEAEFVDVDESAEEDDDQEELESE